MSALIVNQKILIRERGQQTFALGVTPVALCFWKSGGELWPKNSDNLS
ncbi:MAG: hypothetical protein ACXADF_00250 [Candidatus Thorarchaeota archaeon]